MPNTIALFKNYIDLLDEVYKNAAITSDLDSDASFAKQGANANEIVIPKLAMDGLANYSRNSGYVDGDVELTHETVTFNYDRGRMFTVDAMDNEETAGVAFGKLSSEFIRTKVVPEMDAFTFAVLAGLDGISAVSADLVAGADVISALRAATNKMDEDEVPMENRFLYITPTLKGIIDDLDTTKSREVMSRFSKVKLVPQTRFYTAIDLKDGTADGEKTGGYAKNADGKNINFMVIDKSAVIKYPKHNVNKVVSPEDNQTSDGWKFGYRAYGLVDAYENKRAGIYLNHATS